MNVNGVNTQVRKVGNKKQRANYWFRALSWKAITKLTENFLWSPLRARDLKIIKKGFRTGLTKLGQKQTFKSTTWLTYKKIYC